MLRLVYLSLAFILLVFHGSEAHQTKKANNTATEDDVPGNSRSNILVLKEIETNDDEKEDGGFVEDSPLKISKKSENEGQEAGDEGDANSADSSAISEEDSSYAVYSLPTVSPIVLRQIIRNATAFIIGDGQSQFHRVLQNETDDSATEGEDTDDVEAAYSSESHSLSPGVKNVHNISLSASTYQSLSGNSKSPRLGNRTEKVPLSLNKNSSNTYSTGMKAPFAVASPQSSLVTDKGKSTKENQKTAEAGNTGKVQNKAASNSYVILSTDHKNKTKKVKMTADNTLPNLKQKQYKQQPHYLIKMAKAQSTTKLIQKQQSKEKAKTEALSPAVKTQFQQNQPASKETEQKPSTEQQNYLNNQNQNQQNTNNNTPAKPLTQPSNQQQYLAPNQKQSQQNNITLSKAAGQHTNQQAQQQSYQTNEKSTQQNDEDESENVNQPEEQTLPDDQKYQPTNPKTDKESDETIDQPSEQQHQPQNPNITQQNNINSSGNVTQPAEKQVPNLQQYQLSKPKLKLPKQAKAINQQAKQQNGTGNQEVAMQNDDSIPENMSQSAEDQQIDEVDQKPLKQGNVKQAEATKQQAKPQLYQAQQKAAQQNMSDAASQPTEQQQINQLNPKPMQQGNNELTGAGSQTQQSDGQLGEAENQPDKQDSDVNETEMKQAFSNSTGYSMNGANYDPTYGPWKTIDINQALLKNNSSNTESETKENTNSFLLSQKKQKSKSQATLVLKLGKKMGKNKDKKINKSSSKLKKGKKNIKKNKQKKKKSNKKQKQKKKQTKYHSKTHSTKNKKKTAKAKQKELKKKKIKAFKGKDLSKVPESEYKVPTIQNKHKNKNDQKDEKDNESEQSDKNKEDVNNNDEASKEKNEDSSDENENEENKDENENGREKHNNKQNEIEGGDDEYGSGSGINPSKNKSKGDKNEKVKKPKSHGKTHNIKNKNKKDKKQLKLKKIKTFKGKELPKIPESEYKVPTTQNKQKNKNGQNHQGDKEDTAEQDNENEDNDGDEENEKTPKENKEENEKASKQNGNEENEENEDDIHDNEKNKQKPNTNEEQNQIEGPDEEYGKNSSSNAEEKKDKDENNGTKTETEKEHSKINVSNKTENEEKEEGKIHNEKEKPQENVKETPKMPKVDKERNQNNNGSKENETIEKGGKETDQDGSVDASNNTTENVSISTHNHGGKIKVSNVSEVEENKDEEALKMAMEGKPTVKPSNPATQQHVDDSDLEEKDGVEQNGRTQELQKTLSNLRFMNGASGKVHTGQQFSYISQCGLYVEPQNVSQAQHSWVTKTYSPYFYLYEKPKDYEKCKPSDWLYGKDMRGSVFLSFEVKSLHGSNLTNNAKICEKYCCKEPRCEAWVLRFQESATNNCPENSFCCWLKNTVPPIENYYLEGASVAGVVHRKHFKNPPSGMRSAVPLGGLAAGSFEMRADGTFHEWTIENQSPGGSAKLSKTALDKMFLGVRVKQGDEKANTAVLKTHTSKGFENETVKSLEYFGAYPVSKFAIELFDDFKDKVELNLYAFSPFHPRDAIESATPATSFSLEVVNLSPHEETEISFMLNIPFGYNEDTGRKGGNYQEAEYSRKVTPADCQRECAKRVDCQSWSTSGPNTCVLKDTIPLHSTDYGVVSGIRGDWKVQDGLLTCQRPGFSPQSGDISVYPVQSGSEEMTYIVTNEVDKAWDHFKKYGHVNGNSSHTMKINQTGLHGAVSVSTRLKPNETKLLSIIFAWYFPNKDIADERVGNFYTNMFKNSIGVAKHFEEDMLGSATDTLNWHTTMFTPPSIKSSNDSTEYDEDDNESTGRYTPPTNCSTKVNGVSTLPVCLQDILVNSMSFLRTAMWFENGRWRQWEAFDCANLDPVHIDFHRIIPYMIFYPDLVKQIMFSWADHQMSNLENGMIQESLSQGCLEETSHEGNAGGRQMADVNVAFITQAFLVYSWTNDTEFFNQIYPYTVRAMQWLIHRSTKNSGLPHRRPGTFDLFELEKYDHCAYNSILYLLSLRIMKKMSEIQMDEKTLTDVYKALDKAETLFDVEMWDEKKGFYHAWFDDEWGSPGWVMADIFYGQVWSYTLGIGNLVDKDKIQKHLKKEEKRNDSPFGLKILTKSEDANEIEDTSIILGEEMNSCKSLENITKTNSIWMSSSTDWSTLQLHLGMNPEKAMEQAIKSLDNYRTTLRDQWNFHGITSSNHYGLDGLPWATSHYTLHLVLWHLPLALSGQQYYAPEGKIKFSPKYSPPYWLPFFTPFCMGNIEAKEKDDSNITEIVYKVTVTSGRCQFNELSISKSKYSEKVDITEGESIAWSTPKLSQADRIKSMLDLLKKH